MEKEIDFEQELYKAFGQVKDFTLGMQIAKRFYEMGRQYQEPVSENLEEEIKQYLNKEVIVTNEDVVISKHHEFHNFYVENLEEVARHFANWQKQKDGNLYDMGVIAGRNFGKADMKQQMMKDAVEATVLENYDGKVLSYDEALMDNKNLCHCCVGDKVKVIIIKTEE